MYARGPKRSRSLVFLPLVLLLLLAASRTSAQTCFAYVDGCSRPGWTLPFALPNCVNARVPIRCVTQGSVGGVLDDTSFDGDCHEDANFDDCAVAVLGPTQSNLEMHTEWHDCFGNVGDSDGDNPPGRGARWYAFHRQFEFDFKQWRDAEGWGSIEHLDWCPNMLLPEGHPSGGWPSGGAGAHPALCGTGPNRPPDTPCPECIAFPQCLFIGGGGPIACPAAPSPNCAADTLSFPYTALDDFQNVEEVTTILDHVFHGQMHGAVGVADRFGPTCNPFVFGGDVSDCYVLDVIDPSCSPRDPMFWRLHKALDDVVRAWQNLKAVDIVLVVDTSGSMAEPDANTGDTKLEAALDAVHSFADLMDLARADGQENNIGIVSFSDSPVTRMPMTPADPNLLLSGGDLEDAIDDIRNAGPGGCTGIGGGIQRALELLCPPSGDCRGFNVPGDNDRKAILLLTDGMENRPPCLQPAGSTPNPSCGNECFGAAFEFERMEFTQMVGVGFGDAGSLNGDLLTLIAERQGGIYMQSPNAAGSDLKDYFAKAFGTLTSDFVAVDPKGTLAAGDAASDPTLYNSCSDAMITFASGWNRDVKPGDLRLLVNSPSGDLVRGTLPAVRTSNERVWANARVRLPYRSASAGTWRAQLVRPHFAFVNGFAPDAFADLRDGVTLVRREIQRLCPDGCSRVLFFESGLRGKSAYAEAVAREREAGLLGAVNVVTSANDFQAALANSWDLIVYAYMGKDAAQPYDGALAQRICRGDRAILTDTRPRHAAEIFRCAGAQTDGTTNWQEITGDARLVDDAIKMINPGHEIATYGLRIVPAVQAWANNRQSGAVHARTAEGQAQNWFVDVLTEGLGRLSPVREKMRWSTGEDLVAVVRMLPSDVRAGGWDHVDARVEIEYPTVGLGTLLARAKRGDFEQKRGELLDPRAAALSGLTIPTATITVPLYDDGTHGDQYAGNAYWTARLPGFARTDGMYKFRYILDLTANGCTTRRELVQSMFVHAGVVDGGEKTTTRVTTVPLPGGRVRATVTLRPADAFGNLLGPGHTDTAVTCNPKDRCSVDRVQDHGDGTYTAVVTTVAGRRSVRLNALGGTFSIPLPCDTCPRIVKIALPQSRFSEHLKTEGTVTLSAPSAPNGPGTVVFLESSHPNVAHVPEMITIPPGRSEASFPVQLLHTHEGPVHVTLTASEGRDVVSRSFVVTPVVQKKPEPPLPLKRYFHPPKGHDPQKPAAEHGHGGN